MTTPGRGESRLDQQECRAVLTGCRYGRLVFTEQALPVVVPVAFALDGEAVLVADQGDTLRNVTDGSVVVFQADLAGAQEGVTDSVTVTGYAISVDDPAERALLTLPWNGHGGGRVVRIVPAIVRGRRFHLPHA